MNLTPGELYFIGEDDPDDGSRTPLVKIGIVKESEDRTAETRLEEHQTGNPRRLRMLHTLSPSAVERIETLLHAEFAPRRIGGEWFHLPGAEFEMAIERATARIGEASAGSPALQDAEDLKAKTSNGQSLNPDAATLELHRRLLDVRKQQDEVRGLEKQIKDALLEATRDATEGSPYVREESRAPRKAFDKGAFTAAHPDLAERYTVEKHTFTRRFVLADLQAHVSDIRKDNPALFEHLAAVLESLAAGDSASELHRQHLDYEYRPESDVDHAAEALS
jgi:hypothetical protein